MIDNFVTIVHDQLYLVLEHPDGIVYAPCEYDWQAHEATFDQRLQVQIRTTQCLLPFREKETAIQKLISVHQRIMVPGGTVRELNYQTN